MRTAISPGGAARTASAVNWNGCPVTAPPPGYDWDNECQPQGAGVRFTLSVVTKDGLVPRASAATNDDGLLLFDALPPGTYALREVTGPWCRAKSDAVDAQGNVVVTAGRRSSVWVYNCLGTRNPPNTGAGPLPASDAEVKNARCADRPLWLGCALFSRGAPPRDGCTRSSAG